MTDTQQRTGRATGSRAVAPRSGSGAREAGEQMRKQREAAQQAKRTAASDAPPPPPPGATPSSASTTPANSASRNQRPQGTSAAPPPPPVAAETDLAASKSSRKLSLKRGRRSDAPGKPQRPPREVRQVEKRAGREAAVVDGELHFIPPVGVPVGDQRIRRQRMIVGGAIASVTSVGILMAGASMLVTSATNHRTTMNLDPSQISQYHLDSYNVAAGSAFAGRYLTQCLSRSAKDSNDNAAQLLQAQITAESTVQDPACQSSGENIKDRTIVSTAYAGSATPVANASNARYITMQTLDSAGVTTRYTVPVNLANPATGDGPRVIGPIAAVPDATPANAIPDNHDFSVSTDDGLANQMQQQFIPNFMNAWASSDSTLSQYLTTSASSTANLGLQGALSKVQVSSVVANVPAGMSAGHYKTGSTVPLIVAVTGIDRNGNQTAATYRVMITNDASGKWLVSDVSGSYVDTSNLNDSSASPVPQSPPTPGS